MRQGRLLWRIYLSFLCATLAALAITTGLAVRALRSLHEEQVARDLRVRARLVARDMAHCALDGDALDLDRVCKELGRLTDTRITVVLPGGLVIGDSDEDPKAMDNHAGRPEIAAAARGAIGESTRFSDTLKQTLEYVAIPVERDGEIVAVVRVSQPLAEIRWARHLLSRQILLGGACTALLFAAVALYLSRRITRPLEEMRRVAMRLADGDLACRVDVSAFDELGALARTLNEMAAQLSERMDTIARQRVEQNAVLGCMVEGVLAVDPGGRILYINDAAARLFDVTPEQTRGATVQEMVRHHELQGFIMATLTNTGTSEAQLTMRGDANRHVQLHGTPLTDPAGHRMGGLVVMHDITQLKRLETVRSDFIANASHELKTPITALKGCVETLADEAAPSPEEAARFIGMMSRHVNRLEAIVDDLLSLSRIEFRARHEQLERHPAPIADILRHAVGSVAEQARAKGIVLNVVCPEGLQAPVDAALLETAVGNLADNAVKYSGAGTRVSITAASEDGDIAIRVADQGPGIEKQHLPRIFERFYRVDQARSRALGGTGLGLSIVKHIALSHQGSVTVDSVLGQGTTFTLRLPQL